MSEVATRASVLVVDAANVVGSVPDGWWRDRAGAARRLHAHLVAGSLRYDRIVLVLEGKARAGVPVGTVPRDSGEGHVETVHAPASGDDELVAQCAALAASGASVVLATADRGLIARVGGTAAIVGPRTARNA